MDDTRTDDTRTGARATAGDFDLELEGLDQEGREQQEERRSSREPSGIVSTRRSGREKRRSRAWHRRSHIEAKT